MSRLVVIDPDKRRREFPAGERVTIGRDWSNDIQLLDVKVSRNHAVIERENGGFILRDLASHNGSFVNEDLVAEQPLSDGDLIKIGETVILFQPGDAHPEGKDSEAARSSSEDISSDLTVALQGDFEARFLDTGETDTEKLVRAHRDLTALFEIGNVVNTERDEDALLSQLANKILGIIPCDTLNIVEQHDPDAEALVRVSLNRSGKEPGTAKLSMTVLRQVVEEGQSILSYDASMDERFAESASVVFHQLRSVMCAPVRSRDNIIGFIFACTESSGAKFSRNDLQMLTAIGIEAGIALQNLRLFDDLDSLFLTTIQALANTIDAKDGYTGGHSRRVAENAVVVAKALGCSESDIRWIRLGGTLHDIGKIGVPDEVLKLPGRFGPEQRLYMQQHPALGSEILKPIPRMVRVQEIVRHHHEWWDGSGYPDGLKGEDIPLGARIVAITDAFDAVTSTRVYRKGRPTSVAVDILTGGAGTQFDPDLVPVFLAEVEKGLAQVADA